MPTQQRDLRAWHEWIAREGFLPATHLPLLAKVHPELRRGGTGASEVQKTSEAYFDEKTGYWHGYRFIPGKRGIEAKGVRFSFSETTPAAALRFAIQLLEVDERGLNMIFDSALPYSKQQLRDGITDRKAIRMEFVDVDDEPPRADAGHYQISYEYNHSKLNFIAWQIDNGVFGPARLNRCFQGWANKISGNVSHGLYNLLAQDTLLETSILQKFMVVGGPVVPVEFRHMRPQQVPLDRFAGSNPTAHQFAGLLRLARHEYLWEPHDNWTTSAAADFRRYAHLMAHHKPEE